MVRELTARFFVTGVELDRDDPTNSTIVVMGGVAIPVAPTDIPILLRTKSIRVTFVTPDQEERHD